MEYAITAFSLLKDDKPSNDGNIYYFLLFDGNKTGVRTYCESIFAQYHLVKSNRYLIVLENSYWEGDDYVFYLLDARCEVLDCMNVIWFEGDPGHIQHYQLSDDEFCFEKYENNKKYTLRISDEGELRYSGADFKYRALLDFIKPRKFLALAVQG
ncbi:hypothetical protein HA052_09025 [Chromobacterium haemolyticum]|uniref:Uncharacterized protein n=1 Tax=Chromobacterium fluminis TaxID=3044269 RepID=A0ABX0L0U5_9NEIS|nr:hypothetical protein [Chromobacterium haemolyticum]NHR05344.1 hypothetical protein [Chromobacterium haemolyticum]